MIKVTWEVTFEKTGESMTITIITKSPTIPEASGKMNKIVRDLPDKSWKLSSSRVLQIEQE